MSSVYRCQQCGLHSRVQLGATAEPLEVIHCPRCGGQALREPGADTAPAVDVVVSPDGRTTRELAGLAENASDEGATRRVEDDETRRDVSENTTDKLGRPQTHTPPAMAGQTTPVGSPPLAFGSSPQGKLPPVTQLRTVDVGEVPPAGADAEPRAPRLAGAPAVEPPAPHTRTTRRYASVDGLPRPAAQSPSDAEGGTPGPYASFPPPPGFGPSPGPAPPPPDRAVVSATPLGPMYTGPGRSARPADSFPPPEQPGSDSLGQAASDLALAGGHWATAEPPRYTPFAPPPQAVPPPGSPPGPPPDGYAGGKAWSADAIQRALQASGYDPASGSTPIPVGPQTSSLPQLPDSPRLLIDAPGHLTPPAVHIHVPQPAPGSFSHDAPTAPRGGSFERHDPPPVQVVRPRKSRSGPRTNVLQPRRRSRGLFIALICVAMVSVGVVIGVLLYSRGQRAQEESGLTLVSYRAADLERAEQRAATYGLPAVDPRPPFEAAYRVASLDEARSVALDLALRNTGDREIAVLRLTTSWLLVHEGPRLYVSDGGQPDRPVSVAEPLRPGQTVTVRIEVPSGDPAAGPARESFLWIQVVLADPNANVFYEGGIMIDLAVGPA